MNRKRQDRVGDAWYEALQEAKQEYEGWPASFKSAGMIGLDPFEENDRARGFGLLSDPEIRRHYRNGRIGQNINEAQAA